MTTVRRCRLAVAAVVLAATPAALEAGRPLRAPTLDRSSGIDIGLASDFWEPPSSVTVPLRARVRNASSRTRTLELVFTARNRTLGCTLVSRYPVRVEPGATAALEMVVPLCPRDASGPMYAGHLTVSARGDASGPETAISDRYVPPSNRVLTPALAMSDGLARRNWAPLQTALESAGRDLIGSRFDPRELPRDWRAWASFGAVLLTEEEWLALRPEARAALQEWTAAGGTLLLAGDVSDPRSRGLGSIRSLAATGGEIDLTAVLTALRAVPSPPMDLLTSDVDPLVAKRLGEPRTPTGPLAMVILGYAFAVGPLNLWVLRGRRQHVFWTTPAIAALACLLLGSVILLHDGIGGAGWRSASVVLVPEEGRSVLLQEQAVRTGMTLARAFRPREPVLMMPLPRAGYRPPARLEISGQRFSGDWVTSRSLQGHFLEAVRPSEAAVRLIDVPTGRSVLSTFPVTLDALHVIDADGFRWMTRGPVPPGVATPLLGEPPGALENWWEGRLARAGAHVRNRLRPLGSRRAWFYASAPDPGAEVLPTIPFVRWQDAPLLVLGPVG